MIPLRLTPKEQYDLADEILVIGMLQDRGSAGASATDIALAATQHGRRPGVKHLKWLGTKIGDRLVRQGKLERIGDRFRCSDFGPAKATRGEVRR